MKKQQPTLLPGHDSADRPPPYSSLLGLQTQESTPVQLATIRTPIPISISQDRPPSYDRIERAILENAKSVPQPAFIGMCEPVAEISAVDQGVTSEEAPIVSSDNSEKGIDICGYFKMAVAIAVLLIILGVGLHIYLRTQYNKAHATKIPEETSYWEVPAFQESYSFQRQRVSDALFVAMIRARNLERANRKRNRQTFNGASKDVDGAVDYKDNTDSDKFIESDAKSHRRKREIIPDTRYKFRQILR